MGILFLHGMYFPGSQTIYSGKKKLIYEASDEPFHACDHLFKPTFYLKTDLSIPSESSQNGY